MPSPIINAVGSSFMFRIKGTVILRIWWQLCFVLIYTCAIVSLHLYIPRMKMDFPTALVNVLGVVIGLLLVFRTNTAYDRYWEGRRLWSSMTQNIRALTRGIWEDVKESGTSEEIVEKRSVLNLLIAFAYATKNYLREEYTYDSDGIRDLLAHIPQFATPSSTLSLQSQQAIGEAHRASFARPEVQQNQGQNDESSIPPSKVIPTIVVHDPENMGKDDKTMSTDITSPKGNSPNLVRRKTNIVPKSTSLMARDCITPTNIPIEISYYIASYLNAVCVKGRDLVDPMAMQIMRQALNNMVDCLSGFERILRTPIPLAYSVHLHHIIWLYLLALPFQYVNILGWWTVATVVLSAFALLGILDIGWEIENPFGYDDNDLPLDDFCTVIHKEVLAIVGHKVQPPKSWLISTKNRPLSPSCMENAVELSSRPVEEVRRLLTHEASTRLETN